MQGDIWAQTETSGRNAAVLQFRLGWGASDERGARLAIPPLTLHYGHDVYRFVARTTNGSRRRTTLWLRSRAADGVSLTIWMWGDARNASSARLEGRVASPWEMEVTGGRLNKGGSDPFDEGELEPAVGRVVLAGRWLGSRGIRVGLHAGLHYELIAELVGRAKFWEMRDL